MNRQIVFPIVVLLGCTATGCGQSDETVSRDGVELQRGLGKADGSSSCENICGQQARSGCWCDADCAKYGDCCADRSTYCDTKPASCAGYCDKKTPAGCWCDANCSKYGDCCTDMAAVCGGPVDKCAGVTCTPPAPTCQGNDLVTAKSSACDPATGQCVDVTEKTTCAGGCADGACKPVDKCAGVTCTPPAPTCQGNDLVTAKSSACDPATGQCVDVTEKTTCADGCANGACKPAATNDPFDPAICTGPMMTKAQAVALFAPGTSDVIIGNYTILMRSRTCNSMTGCGAWGTPTDKLGSSLGSMSRDMSMKGDIHLKISGNNVQLQLANGGYGSSDGSSCSSVGSQQSCSNYNYICGYQWGGSGGMYPTQSSVVKADYNGLTLSGLLAETCIRLTDSASSKPGSNGNYQEEQYVLFTKLSTPTTPTKPLCPAGQNLMTCGSKASPGMTICCQMGLTTCPQSGCDCWSACS